MSTSEPDREETAGAPAAGPRGGVAPPSGEHLFRRRALERYARRDEESVLPRLARPPVFAALWVLAALLLILAGVVGALPVADERTIPLVITDDGPHLILPADALLPSKDAVSSGDPVRFVLAGAALRGRVGAVGDPLSPEELKGRLRVDGLVLDGPHRMATIDRIDTPVDLALHFDASRGAVVQARVTVDRPRVATLLPGVGPWIARWIHDPGHGEEASP